MAIDTTKEGIIDIQTKYASLDDIKIYYGVDLVSELGEQQAQAFLKRVEDRISITLNSCYHRNIDLEYPEFSDYQKECYMKAIIEQAFYTYKNGDIITDSGMELDKGELFSNSTRFKKWLSPLAKDYLMECGLLTRQIKGKRGGYYII